MDTTEHDASDEHTASEVLHHPLDALKSVVPDDAVKLVTDLPARLEAELRERPYRSLAVAVGLGVGIGALASSRITRFLVTNLGGFVLTELARRGAKRYLEQMLNAH